MNLVFGKIFDEKAMFLEVPGDLRMLLADGVLVCQTKIVRVLGPLLTPNVDFQRTVLFDVELSAVLSNYLGEGRLSGLLLAQVGMASLVWSDLLLGGWLSILLRDGRDRH